MPARKPPPPGEKPQRERLLGRLAHRKTLRTSSGQGLPMIGKLLGHTLVQTTARYAHLATDPVKLAANSVSNQLAGDDGGLTLGSELKVLPPDGDELATLEGAGIADQQKRAVADARQAIIAGGDELADFCGAETPAMALGLTDHPWSIAELMDAASATPSEPEPQPVPPRLLRRRLSNGDRSSG